MIPGSLLEPMIPGSLLEPMIPGSVLEPMIPGSVLELMIPGSVLEPRKWYPQIKVLSQYIHYVGCEPTSVSEVKELLAHIPKHM